MGIDFNKWGNEDLSIDFDRINAIALSSITTVLSNYLPGGRVKGAEYICGNIFGGLGDSCSTNLNTGVGSDFSAGMKWGDPIDLVSKVRGVRQSDAAAMLSDLLGITDSTPTPKIERQSSEEKHLAGQKHALELWQNAETDCPNNHPYLAKKQVNTDTGIRFDRTTGNILVPLYDENGMLWSVQRISPDGSEKKISNNGKMSGNFFTIEGDRDMVYLCEGYATAKSIAMVTGKTAIMAVSTGNLAPVAEKIVKLYQGANIIFAADNDQDKPDNPGLKAAEKAKSAIGRGSIAMPPFPAGVKGDWNDYLCEHGMTATRKLLLFSDQGQILVDITTVEDREPEYLVEDCIETPCTGMIFGPSGGGKSFFVLDLALHCATGKEWNGKKVKPGPVIYICGEGRNAIKRRVRAWEHHHETRIQPNMFRLTNISMTFEPEEVDRLVREIDEIVKVSGVQPVAIFTDTMARALPGNADENSTKDVGNFISECDKLQTKYNCSKILVHHTGHADKGRARGSSSLIGAMDVAILVNKEGTIEWTKCKDMEEPQPVGFTLKKIHYGDRKADNSCVVEYDFNIATKGSKMTANYKAAIKSLYEAVASGGLDNRCLIGTWRDIYKSYMGAVSERAKNKSFSDQVKELEDKNMVVVTGNNVSPVRLRDDLIADGMFRGLL